MIALFVYKIDESSIRLFTSLLRYWLYCSYKIQYKIQDISFGLCKQLIQRKLVSTGVTIIFKKIQVINISIEIDEIRNK